MFLDDDDDDQDSKSCFGRGVEREVYELFYRRKVLDKRRQRENFFYLLKIRNEFSVDFCYKKWVPFY